MNLILPLVLVGAAVVGWWLSGYDSRVTGENKGADLQRRIIRCGVTVVLLAVGIELGGFAYVALAVPIAILWAGCAGEFLAQTVHALIDSPGVGNSTSKTVTATLDRLAALFEQGRNEEAIAFCAALVESRETSELAMETMLFRIYDRVFSDERLLSSPVPAEANRLAANGHVPEAEASLRLALKRDPKDLSSALMLMKLYVQHLRAPDKAGALVRELNQRPAVPPFFATYASQRIVKWLNPVAPEQASEGIESLLAPGK